MTHKKSHNNMVVKNKKPSVLCVDLHLTGRGMSWCVNVTQYDCGM